MTEGRKRPAVILVSDIPRIRSQLIDRLFVAEGEVLVIDTETDIWAQGERRALAAVPPGLVELFTPLDELERRLCGVKSIRHTLTQNDRNRRKRDRKKRR